MIIDLYFLVEKLTGSSMFLWGLALFFNPRILTSFFNVFVENEKENETLRYFIAGLFLTFGLIIVWVHNDWHPAFSSLLVTLVGWILVIKAMLWISFPRLLSKIGKKFFKNIIKSTWFAYAYSLGLILVGLFILLADQFFYFVI